MVLIRFIFFCLLALPTQGAARDMVVFAAASLKEPLDAIAADFGNVVVSYGGSGAIARQVGQGAPADVVALAHPDWMTVLVDEADVDAPFDLATNRLVLVAPTPSQVPLTSDGVVAALGAGRLGVGAVRSVPAGIYARDAFQALGIWDSVRDRLAEVDNVRAVLALAARGEVPLGVVYATDARISDKVHVVAQFPAASHLPIRYQAAKVAASDHPQAEEFAQFLASPAAQAHFQAAGFLAPVAAP